jgi:hypothetical protein
VGALGGGLDAGASTQEPLRETHNAYSEHPIPDQPFSGRRGQGRARALFARGPRLGAAFRGGNPSSEKHERFGSTDRALLAVADVFAIEAEPGYAELHV